MRSLTNSYDKQMIVGQLSPSVLVCSSALCLSHGPAMSSILLVFLSVIEVVGLLSGFLTRWSACTGASQNI